VLALLSTINTDKTGKPDAINYSAFLDQIEAGNVVTVTFQGMQVYGRFKHPLDGRYSSGSLPLNTFSSRVPDFGDPMLIAELRKQHVVIEVGSPSLLPSLLAHLPLPLLFFLGAGIFAGVIRMMCGKNVPLEATDSTLPTHGMIGILSRLFNTKNK
jgi:ATP-dependent Zn protease